MDGFDPAKATAQWLATLSPEETQRAIAYTRGGHWLLLWDLLVSLAASWLIIRVGILSALRDAM